MTRSDERRPRFAAPVVCLLPARNAAEYLPAWFESVERIADAVVALDDGSTDQTAELLAAHPLVRVLLRNPRRPGYHGWDDSENRNRLLAAAAALHPGWIISVDADELVPPDGAAALRAFIDDRAVTGVAYGLPVYRMIDDLAHFDRRESIAMRLFAHRPGQRFPDDRFHFQPVPTSIPPSRWLSTDIRVQHVNGLTDERRRARRRKFAEADPDGRWQDEDYAYLDSPPGPRRAWPVRRPGQPVVLEARSAQPELGSEQGFEEWSDGAIDVGGPVLTAVFVVDESGIDEMATLHRLVVRHRTTTLVDDIVLAQGAEVADDVARLLPHATVIRVPRGASPGAVRNVGLRVAQGDYVVCFDGPADLAPGALDSLVHLHDAGHAVVTGSVGPGDPSAAGWATYFDGPTRASFAREPLLRLGGFDEGCSDVESEARDRLVRAGQRVAHTPHLTFRHHTALASPGEYLSARFRSGGSALGETWRRWRSTSDDVRPVRRRVAPLLAGGAVLGALGRLRGRWPRGSASRPR